MEIYNELFIPKFQPKFIEEFEINPEIVNVLNTLIDMDNLNILFIGNEGSGKTSLLNAVIREYYKGTSFKVYNENILHINNLKEQGINYYRNDVKTFCQIGSSVKHKKKFIVFSLLIKLSFIYHLKEENKLDWRSKISPEQIAVLPISEKYQDYAQEVYSFFEENNIVGYLDHRDEKIGRKIRDAEMKKVPYMIIIGEKEEGEQKISVRKHGEGDLGTLTIQEFKEIFEKEVNNAIKV